jgi:hypothetical protein
MTGSCSGGPAAHSLDLGGWGRANSRRTCIIRRESDVEIVYFLQSYEWGKGYAAEMV